MSQDETVDGARIAADILRHMEPDDQDRLLVAIQRKSPEVAAKLEDSLFNLQSLTALPDRAVQHILREVPIRDVVLSMKAADPEVKEKLWDTMSEYKQQLVREEFAALPATRSTDVHAAQRRIMRKVQELYPEAEKTEEGTKPKMPRLA